MNKDELIAKLDEWFETVYAYGNAEDKQAYQQIKKCINKAFAIPDTSEREAELEEVIIKMQAEIDKLQHESLAQEKSIPTKNVDKEFVEEKTIELVRIINSYPYTMEMIENRKIRLQDFIRSLVSEVRQPISDKIQPQKLIVNRKTIADFHRNLMTIQYDTIDDEESYDREIEYIIQWLQSKGIGVKDDKK